VNNIIRLFIFLLAGCSLTLATSCEGVFGGIYNENKGSDINVKAGQLYINATSWTDWYYIDLDSLEEIINGGDAAALLKAQTVFTPWPIPQTEDTEAARDNSGMYTYWFDIFGKGMSNYERRGYTPTAPQPEPEHWTFAVHRDNVRTNGGCVYETDFTSMDDLPASATAFSDKTFTADTWSERDVWVNREQMLNCIMGNQGININQVLSSWLTFNIPPIPPTYTFNNHVFILRTKEGEYFALQLQSYMNDQGTTCYLTINYKKLAP
jgi:hypothetical protein